MRSKGIPPFRSDRQVIIVSCEHETKSSEAVVVLVRVASIKSGPLETMSVISVVKRTPAEALRNVVGWEWGEPAFFTSRLFNADVRVAYWDLGPEEAKETILLTHGEPSWSYLNRRMINPLLKKGGTGLSHPFPVLFRSSIIP